MRFHSSTTRARRRECERISEDVGKRDSTSQRNDRRSCRRGWGRAASRGRDPRFRSTRARRRRVAGCERVARVPSSGQPWNLRANRHTPQRPRDPALAARSRNQRAHGGRRKHARRPCDHRAGGRRTRVARGRYDGCVGAATRSRCVESVSARRASAQSCAADRRRAPEEFGRSVPIPTIEMRSRDRRASGRCR